MLNEKQRARIRKYKNTDGLQRLWYWIVIDLTMGDVEAVIAQYDRELVEEQNKRLEDFTSSQQTAERCAPKPYGTQSGRMKTKEPMIVVREEEEEEEIDALTAVILASHMHEMSQHGQLDGTPNETPSNEWGGFGGGGDFGGGGAGGSWEESPTVGASTSGGVDLGSDSY
jgi:hypothetical protein